MSKALSYAFPVSIELVGIFLVAIGIAVELATGGDIGHTLITLGSVTIAIGSLLWSKILKVKPNKK